MLDLRNNDDIIIKQADKGGLPCFINRWAYVREAYRQLLNHKYYTNISQSLKDQTCSNINETLDSLLENGYITEQQSTFLYASPRSRERDFYLLPKLHKPASTWPHPDMPEGRPIISDICTESRNVSDFIDFYLKPLSNKHPSYIKDTYDFLDKIRDKVIPPDSFLVSADISSLYTNMNINRSIAVVKRYFKKYCYLIDLMRK